MTYKEAFHVVRVWTLAETKRQLPTLAPSFLRDIAHLRVYQGAVYREIRIAIEGQSEQRGKPQRPQALGRVTTYAELQQRRNQDGGAHHV